MRYTVARLHKELGKLIDKGHGRRIVCIDKDSFTHNCESNGVTILEVAGIGIEMVPVADDDGGILLNKNGSEREMVALILVGDDRANEKGEVLPQNVWWIPDDDCGAWNE